MLEIKNLNFKYAQRQVLTDISCEINRGEFVGIIGPNGAGKTTLLKLIDALLSPPHNSVFFNGQSLHTYDRKSLARLIAYVPQELEVIFGYSVRDVVRMGRFPHVAGVGFLSEGDEQIVEDSIKLMDVTRFLDRKFNELSGGERQRVVIASALAQEPRVILLDEPTSSLDLHHQIEIYKILKNEQTTNKLTVIVVTHDINLAAQFCERLLLLHKGKLLSDGIPNEVLQFNTLQSVFGVNVYIDINPLTQSIYVLPYADKE
jgi:iron complex transport system ATP-binding protein